MPKGSLSFHPEIFQILGEKLVSDPVIAIAELVKNSYDADAEQVRISILSDSIIIEDNGHGMSLDEIEKGWLVIGTPMKRNSSKSRLKGRVFTGSMGIGRLASFSLANKLSIESTTLINEEEYSKTCFELDLKEILKLNNLTEFEIDIKNVITKEKIPIGTTIKLSDLKWNPDSVDLKRIETRLSILRSPTLNADFEIIINIKGEENTLNPERDFPRSPILVRATIDDSGTATYSIEGNSDFYISELKRNNYGRKSLVQFSYLKNVDLLAYWYPLGKRPKVQYWKVVGRDFAKDMRQELAGVRVYRDGVRVLPYGEPGDDWLSIERTYYDAGSRKRYPRSGQIVAWINTSRVDNPELLDTANREGLIENPAFKQLKIFGQESMTVLAEYRRLVEPVVSQEHVIDLDETVEVEDAIERVRNKFQNFRDLSLDLHKFSEEQQGFIDSMNSMKNELLNYVPTEDLQNIKNGLDTNIKLVENINSKIGVYDTILSDVNNIEEYFQSFSEQMDKVAIYRDKLTAGNLINLIVHDVGSAVKRATNRINRASSIECEEPIHNQMLPIVSSLLPRISSAYELLRGGSKVGVERSQRLNITEIANKVDAQLSNISWLDDGVIRISEPIIYARMREADLWAILTNLLLNAITCSEYEHRRGRKFSSERKILLDLERNGRDLVIICEDNGPGLPDVPQGWIWEAFNSTRQGGGSGLGLFIISDIISWYGGSKSAKSSEKFESGARFEIILSDVILNA